VEVKLIIYIIGGVLYFFYKKMQDDKKKAAENTAPVNDEPQTEAPKPVSAPARNPLDDLRRELKRQQEAAEAQKKLSIPPPQPFQTSQKANTPKDIFIHEKKKATFGEGANDAPVYERDISPSEKTVRGDIKLKNEGVYRIESLEEAKTGNDDAEAEAYVLDAKQAFIGSVIFERKF
jgi:hypothetical protein